MARLDNLGNNGRCITNHRAAINSRALPLHEPKQVRNGSAGV